ncbi:MAG: DUF3313 domain-containing protein [Desulfobacteraceae bacterium]|nr:DUF3313 domain-containing protein [Desulfobacteraceae bacterium]
MTILVKRWLILMAGLLVVATGCSKKNVSYSEFIGKYDYKPKNGGFSYVKPVADFSSYNKVMMDYLVLFMDEDTEYRGIQADELNEVAHAFHQAVIDEFPSSISLVEKPGPGVLRVRPALTGVTFSKPEPNSITSVYSRNRYPSVRKIPGNPHLSLEDASLEYEFLDSLTRERLAVAVEPCPEVDAKGRVRMEVLNGTFQACAKSLRQKLENLLLP